MSTDQQVARTPESPEISQMLDRLVHEFGFADPQGAIKIALVNLIEDLESDSDDPCDDELREAVEDFKRGERGRPANEVFEELRREFNIPRDV